MSMQGKCLPKGGSSGLQIERSILATCNLQLGWISALCSKTRHLIPFTPKICLLCSYYDVSSEL